VFLCSSLFFMLWCTSTTQMTFTTTMITYVFILFVIIFNFFFSPFHIIVPLLMIKCLIEISFMTMSTTMVTSTTTTMTMKKWIKYCCIHFFENEEKPIGSVSAAEYYGCTGALNFFTIDILIFFIIDIRYFDFILL